MDHQASPTVSDTGRPTLWWWLDQLIGSLAFSLIVPGALLLGGWLFILAGGTTLRLTIERQGIVERRAAIKRSWIMATAGLALAGLLQIGDPEPGLSGFLFVALCWAILPAPLYAAVMPLGGDRWSRRFSARNLVAFARRIARLVKGSVGIS